MTEIPVEDAADLLDEIHELRREVKRLRDAEETRRAPMRGVLDAHQMVVREQRNTIDLQSFQLADRDRVIARLLDGWRPLMNGDEEGWRDIPPGPLWKFSYRSLNVYSPVFEPMSDGEAAIIRQHQERNHAN